MLNSNDPLQVNTSFQVHRKSFGSISAPLHHTLLLQGQDHDGAYTEGKPVGKQSPSMVALAVVTTCENYSCYNHSVNSREASNNTDFSSL